MTITNIEKDTENLTLSMTSEFSYPVERVWQLWSDPRQLERWWGPPTYPATVVDHDLSPGGRVSYFMTGPEGDKSAGWWRIKEVNPPWELVFEDGFADDSGEPNPDMPTMVIRVELSDIADGTRMSVKTTFPSREDMDKLLEMGMQEGMTEAAGQIDAVLADQGAGLGDSFLSE